MGRRHWQEEHLNARERKLSCNMKEEQWLLNRESRNASVDCFKNVHWQTNS